MNSLYPEDAKIREVGLSKTKYHTYDNLEVFQPLVAAFHEAGFYSSRDQEAVNTAEYDTLDIHYYFSDEGVGVQRSEKLLTIVFPHIAIARFSTWITAIPTAVGVTVKKVQVSTELN